MLQQVIYKVIIYISTLYNHEKKILQTVAAIGHWIIFLAGIRLPGAVITKSIRWR